MLCGVKFSRQQRNFSQVYSKQSGFFFPEHIILVHIPNITLFLFSNCRPALHRLQYLCMHTGGQCWLQYNLLSITGTPCHQLCCSKSTTPKDAPVSISLNSQVVNVS